MNIASSPLHLLNMLGSMTNVKDMARSLRTPTKQFNPIDYDVDPNTGCFPPEPLPKLSGPFLKWECALKQAQQVLSLGEDESADALAKRPEGEFWRKTIRSVSCRHPELETRGTNEFE